MEPVSKKRKSPEYEETAAPFELLNDDVLQQVLLRTRARDHSALRCTCHRFHKILESKEFRQLRAQTEWAEVEAAPWTPREHYESELCDEYPEDPEDFQNDYDEIGYIGSYRGQLVENKLRLTVDGKKAGKGSFQLVNRANTRIFHRVCDAVSSELQEIGCCFFSKKGRPRLASLVQALRTEPDPTRGFLYINEMVWNEEYRNSSWVGASGLRSLLMESNLKDKWSVAAYIPYYQTQLTEATRSRLNPYDFKDRRMTEQEVALSDELRRQDMRQFFRAGFRQEKESVASKRPPYVFAVPFFLDQPLLTAKEADSIPVLEPPKTKPLSGANLELFRYMRPTCETMRDLCDQLESLNKLRATDTPNMDKMQELRQTSQQVVQQIQAIQAIPGMEGVDVSSCLPQAESALRELDMLEGIIQRRNQLVTELEGKIADLKTEIRSKVKTFLEDGATLKESFALHTSAANHLPECIDLLLEFVPTEERESTLNGLDQHGHTPLMVAAGIPNGTPKTRHDIVERLTDLGASTDVFNKSGESALGMMRAQERSMNDFTVAFGIGQPTSIETQAIILRTKGMLEPTLGATDADDAYLDSDEFDEDDSDEDEMDDSDEE